MTEPESQRRLHPRVVIGTILVVLIFLFIVENTRQTKMRFLIPEVTAPLWTALFVAALLGALAGALIARHIAAPERRRLRKPRPPSDKTAH